MKSKEQKAAPHRMRNGFQNLFKCLFYGKNLFYAGLISCGFFVVFYINEELVFCTFSAGVRAAL